MVNFVVRCFLHHKSQDLYALVFKIAMKWIGFFVEFDTTNDEQYSMTRVFERASPEFTRRVRYNLGKLTFLCNPSYISVSLNVWNFFLF